MMAPFEYAAAGQGGSRLNAMKPLAFIIVMMNSQFLLGKVSNPLGIDGVQELFYMILLVWALCSLWVQQMSRGHVRALDVSVLLLVVVPAFYGAVMALVTYGQPLIYGLVEERRLFAILIYFPIRTMLDRRWISMAEFEKYVALSAAICALLSIGILFDYVPRFQDLRASEIALRGERISVASGWIALAIPFVVASNSPFVIRWRILLLPLLVGTLLFIIQSRQLILLSLTGAIFVMRGPRAALLLAATVAAFYIAILTIPAVSERIALIVELFSHLGSDDYLDGSWRALSYDYVLANWTDQRFGHGALSPLWRDGFERVIGVFFYLTDIGVVGTLFRYGLLGILLYVIWALLQLRLVRRIADRRHRALMGAVFLFLLMGMPVGAPLEYRGDIAGMLLGLTGYLASRKPAEAGA